MPTKKLKGDLLRKTRVTIISLKNLNLYKSLRNFLESIALRFRTIDKLFSFEKLTITLGILIFVFMTHIKKKANTLFCDQPRFFLNELKLYQQINK